MNEAVENISIHVGSDTSQAVKGFDRLKDAIDKTSSSTSHFTLSTYKSATAMRKSTDETKKNTSATSKNEKEHKKAGNSAHHHASGLARLAAALKRILIYRAIRGVIKAVTSAINEGIERMYAWSEANDQVFMRVMDTYATEVQYLKDAIGAALSPLIEMLMPYLVQLVDWFVELINVVNQFFRALAGYDTWLKVDKVAAKFKEDTEGAAKAQKALNNQLMDFDQLNLITTPKSSGKTDTETPGLSGHYTDIDPKIMAFAESFREKFLKPLESIRNTLSSLWNETLKPLFAEFASGTLETVSFIIGEIDKTLKSFKENGVFDALGNLFSKSNKSTWNLVKIAWGAINKVVTKLSESGTLTKFINSITKFSTGGIDKTADLILKLDESGALDQLAWAFSDVMDSASKIFDAVDDVAGLVTEIAGELLPNLIGGGGGGISFVAELVDGIATSVSGIVEMIEALLGFNGKSVWKGLYKLILGAFIKPFLGIIKLAAGLVEMIDKAMHPGEATNQKWNNFHKNMQGFEDVLDKLPENMEKNLEGTEKELRDYMSALVNSLSTSADKASNNLTYTANATTTELMEIATKYGVDYEALMVKINFSATKEAAERAARELSIEESLASSRENRVKRTRDRLNKLWADGKITNEEYWDSLTKLAMGYESAVNGVIQRVNAKWKQFFDNGKTWGAKFSDDVIAQIKRIAGTEIKIDIKTTQTTGQATIGGGIKVTPSATLYAAGGFPDMGSMFIAGENGAEMVGSINGRTGVASGEEITGIAEAVYGTGATEANLLSAILGAINSKNLTISPSASLGKVVNQSQRLYQGVTG